VTSLLASRLRPYERGQFDVEAMGASRAEAHVAGGPISRPLTKLSSYKSPRPGICGAHNWWPKRRLGRAALQPDPRE